MQTCTKAALSWRCTGGIKVLRMLHACVEMPSFFPLCELVSNLFLLSIFFRCHIFSLYFMFLKYKQKGVWAIFKI